MSNDGNQASLRDILRAARQAPDDAARTQLLYEELRKIDPAQAERLMQRWRERQQRKLAREGTVRSGRDGHGGWWLAAILLLAVLAWVFVAR